MIRYVFYEEDKRQAAIIEKVFKTVRESLDYADYSWSHTTEMEKKHIKTSMVYKLDTGDKSLEEVFNSSDGSSPFDYMAGGELWSKGICTEAGKTELENEIAKIEKRMPRDIDYKYPRSPMRSR